MAANEIETLDKMVAIAIANQTHVERLKLAIIRAVETHKRISTILSASIVTDETSTLLLKQANALESIAEAAGLVVNDFVEIEFVCLDCACGGMVDGSQALGRGQG